MSPRNKNHTNLVLAGKRARLFKKDHWDPEDDLQQAMLGKEIPFIRSAVIISGASKPEVSQESKAQAVRERDKFISSVREGMSRLIIPRHLGKERG